MKQLKQRITVGVVGGSDLVKQQEQLGQNIINEVDYSFSGGWAIILISLLASSILENGLVAYKDGNLIGKQSIATFLGEENIKEVVNFALRYIADLDIPIKRGTFVEFRAGMLNISPIGRNCSREERNQYEVLDLVSPIPSLPLR
jgi:phosphomannomutase